MIAGTVAPLAREAAGAANPAALARLAVVAGSGMLADEDAGAAAWREQQQIGFGFLALALAAKELRDAEYRTEPESPDRSQQEAGVSDAVAEMPSLPQQNPGGIARISAARTETDLAKKAFTAPGTYHALNWFGRNFSGSPHKMKGTQKAAYEADSSARMNVPYRFVVYDLAIGQIKANFRHREGLDTVGGEPNS